VIVADVSHSFQLGELWTNPAVDNLETDREKESNPHKDKDHEDSDFAILIHLDG
jgi:hypothetical protein